MKDKVLYVWFDAPIGYLSITANYTDWELWWKNPQSVKLYQFMGKDNVPFHSVVFPSSELATKCEFTMAHHINTTEYLQYEGDKFSKSRNRGVFGNNAKETGVEVSVWRYYLLAVRPENQDSSFHWHDFVAKNNSELLANFGNFCNRVLKFIDAKYGSVIPDYTAVSEEDVRKKLRESVNPLLREYNEALEVGRLRHGLQVVMQISARGNQFLQESGVNNALFANRPERCAAAVGAAANLIYLLAALVHPYMPSTAADVCAQVNAPQPLIPDTFSGDALLPGHRIGKPRHLFTRIPEEKAEEWRQRFAGGRV
ncbi:MAG: YGR264Cp-like protein [Olpidium bornovanus]|uniref:methionine--tRNA ligase n=1 Tax=Olpidium bornovanus TaxID=278681 RepID=A0A8H7ZXI9_9FUNG|nr:MAG: YGR264Cp-like protein [Olpidium bornovanus]